MADDPFPLGVFPLEGRLSLDRWAAVVGCSRRTIERYLSEHAVPCRRLADAVFVDAGDLWRSLPLETRRSRRK